MTRFLLNALGSAILLGVGSIAGFFAIMFLEGMGHYSGYGAEEFFFGILSLICFLFGALMLWCIVKLWTN